MSASYPLSGERPSVVIVDAVRTPVGRRNGGLSTMHTASVLGLVQRAVVERSALDPHEVEQVVGGCVTQVGMQSLNVTRTAWLSAGLPVETACATNDNLCGSSQQAAGVAASLVAAGTVDVSIGCGAEVMSRVPIGASYSEELGFGRAWPAAYSEHFREVDQFEAAELVAQKYGITRDETDRFGIESQTRAIAAWREDRFAGQYVSVDAPDVGEDGTVLETTHRVERDEGLRESTLEKLAALRTNMPGGIHTAATSSQISDAAAAVLMMSETKAIALGLSPRARIVDTCLVGVDPMVMLDGPIPATQRMLARTGLSIDDIDVFEINEAFASVVLAWQKTVGADPARTNSNGGAIALGHPLGATGCVLITKALYELERIGGRYGLISMCCGGGLGTGTIIERL